MGWTKLSSEVNLDSGLNYNNRKQPRQLLLTLKVVAHNTVIKKYSWILEQYNRCVGGKAGKTLGRDALARSHIAGSILALRLGGATSRMVTLFFIHFLTDLI